MDEGIHGIMTPFYTSISYHDFFSHQDLHFWLLHIRLHGNNWWQRKECVGEKESIWKFTPWNWHLCPPPYFDLYDWYKMLWQGMKIYRSSKVDCNIYCKTKFNKILLNSALFNHYSTKRQNTTLINVDINWQSLTKFDKIQHY